jgi:hypothetical protein
MGSADVSLGRMINFIDVPKGLPTTAADVLSPIPQKKDPVIDILSIN